MAYLTLFGWSFFAATILPLGSEPALAVLVRREYPFWPLVLVATAGNYLGACTTYWLAKAVARDRMPAAARLVASRGAPVLLLSWVPILGDAIVAVAGGVGMPFAAFSAWTLAGKLARYAAVAWIAARV